MDYYEAQINSMQLIESQKTLDRLIALDDSPEKSVADRVNAATSKMETYYYESEALTEELNSIANLSLADQILKLKGFLKTNPSLKGTAYLSEYLYAEGDYKAVVALLEPEIKTYPDWLVGYNNLIPALRNLRSTIKLSLMRFSTSINVKIILKVISLQQRLTLQDPTIKALLISP